MALPRDVADEVRIVAREHRVPAAALLAMVDVESAGQAYAMVRGKRLPIIRWEGHYFYRLLKGAKRDRAVSEGLAHPRAGRVKNPRSQTARWEKLYAPAARIDREAAISSMSWGVGQVMGSHWKWLGYASAEALEDEAANSIAGQVRLMMRYIDKAGLKPALKRLDWNAVARGYNGPAYRKHGYHIKMAKAYARYAGKTPPKPASATMLRLGSKGSRVRELQVLLRRAGHPVAVDGDFGDATHAAVTAFQQTCGLDVDGVAGPQTLRALTAFKSAPNETTDPVPERKAKEAVKNTGVGIGIVGIVSAIRDQIADVAGNLFGLDNDAAQTVASIGMAAAGALAVGLTVWRVWEWWKSGETYEGIEQDGVTA